MWQGRAILDVPIWEMGYFRVAERTERNAPPSRVGPLTYYAQRVAFPARPMEPEKLLTPNS